MKNERLKERLGILQPRPSELPRSVKQRPEARAQRRPNFERTVKQNNRRSAFPPSLLPSFLLPVS